MNRKFKSGIVSIVIIILFAARAQSAEIKYKVSDIPVNLLKDSKAVVRKKEVVFEISGINKAIRKVTYAITILNDNGITNSVFTEFYDKFMTVRKIQINLYDENGNEIKNGANTEVEDYSANVGYSLYEDNRVKFLDPKYRTTPFTVEYSYETSFNGLFSYPDWTVYDDYNISVEKSSLRIIAPEGFRLRYLEKNIDEKCIISSDKGKVNYNWKAENRNAVKKEPFSTSLQEYTPVVYSAPCDFEIDGYNGNMESWDNFGEWLCKLGNERNILGTETTQKIQGLVSGIDNDYEKIKVLYKYLQSKVRYVSVQIGIGGWQTIEAEKVDRLSYGDCKALSNYMKSLLDIVGIRSYYTVVGAGEFAPVVNAGFPSNQFNHAIVCVPLKNDTLWLECTSQSIPFGYLGTFTDNRKVLLTGDGGGTLVRTKKYSIENNKQIRNAVVELDPEGNATSTIQTAYKGLIYDKVCRVLQLDEIDKRKFVQSHISIPNFNLISYAYKEDQELIPSINEKLKLRLANYGSILGNRIILKPNLITRIENQPYKTKERKSDIRIRRAYSNIDTITYILPKGYKIDNIPEPVSIKCKFGEYYSGITSDNKGIRYTRTLSLYEGDYPVTDYPDFSDFFEKISVSDERKIAFIKII